MNSAPRKVDESILQHITYDESLYDLMCSLIEFEVTTESQDFNNIILDESLHKNSALEITYLSNNEKNPFLYYLLVEILFTNYRNEQEAGPIIEIVFFDNYSNLDLMLMHGLLGAKLGHIENLKERDDVIRGLFKRLLIYRPLTKKDFLLNLKAIWPIIDKNKLLRMVIIDSVNSFQFFEDTHKKSDFEFQKDNKKRTSTNFKKNFNKEINARIQENIQKLIAKDKLCTILFKREYFKMQDCFNWDDGKNMFCINARLGGHLFSKNYETKKICLVNFEQINDSTLDIFNKMIKREPNTAILERQPNLNMVLVKPDPQQPLLLTATYTFTGLSFNAFSCFQLNQENYYLANKNENTYPQNTYHH